jgi:hypothetical protein
MSPRSIVMSALFVLIVTTSRAAAQDDIEPRTIGARGRITLGFAGFVDRFASPEEDFPTHATLHVEVARFLTRRIAVIGGLTGSTSFGSDDEDSTGGPGVAALHARGGALYYFTPDAMISAYAGTEYRAPLTARAERESGSVLGLGGLQAAISSRASVFVQGGYGARLTRGNEGELQRRLTADIGFRIRF